jgi:pilus assembly protein CpaE
MAYNPDRIALVLNRADTRVGITGEDVEAIIGRVPDVLIPSDRLIPVSVNEGEPIVLGEERSGAARSFRALAELYIEAKDALEPAATVAAAAAPAAPERPKRRFARRA